MSSTRKPYTAEVSDDEWPVVAPVAVTLLWLIIAGVAMPLAVREDQRIEHLAQHARPPMPQAPPQTPDSLPAR